MGLKDLVDALASPLTKHVNVDVIRRRLYLSDIAIEKVVRAAAAKRGVKTDAFEGSPQGYWCTFEYEGEKVRLLEMPERLVWHGHELRLELSTPEGVELPARPFVNVMASAWVGLFAGTPLGPSLLSSRLPMGVTWDGKVSTVTVVLPPNTPLPSWVRGPNPVKLEIARAESGVWVSLDEGLGDLSAFVALIRTTALDLFASLSGVDDAHRAARTTPGRACHDGPALSSADR